jgi:hypothetical protein
VRRRMQRGGASRGYGGVGVGMIRWDVCGEGWVVQEVGVGCDGVGVGLGGWLVRVEGG